MIREPWFDCQLGKRCSSCPLLPETSQELTELQLQLTQGVFSPRIKRLECEAEHSFPSSIEDKNTWNYTTFFPYAFKV